MSSVKVKFLVMSRVEWKMGMSSVGFIFWLNFECRCQANFGLNASCRMKKWANVACQNKTFMGPIEGIFMHACHNPVNSSANSTQSM